MLRRVHGLSPNAEILVVPKFAAEGAPIREHFERRLSETIGSQKAEILLERATHVFETRFGNFGEFERTIFVDLPDEDSDSKAIKFHIQSTVRQDEKSMEMRSESVSRESVPYALEHLIGIE